MKFMNFVTWVWRRQQPWQRWFLLSFLLMGLALPASAELGAILSGLAAAILGTHAVKWLIWDTARASWAEYKAEQQQIVDILQDKK